MASKTRSRASAAKQEELIVGPKGKSHFRSLDTALKRIADGGTIHLLPGRYVLQGKIPVSVRIVGHGEENKPVEVSIPEPNPVEVKGVTLTLSGCHLSRCLRPSDWMANKENLGDRDIERLEKTSSISVSESGSIVIERCVLEGYVAPEIAVTDGKATLDDCVTTWHRGAVLRVTNDGEAEVARCDFDSSSGDSIQFAGRELLVRGCRFSGYYDGLALSGGKARFEQCVFERSEDYALFAEKSARVELISCQFRNNGVGIYLEGQADVQATGCVFSQNEGGVQVQESSSLRAITCKFLEGKKHGVVIDTDRTADLESCTFDQSHSTGLLVRDGSVRLLACTWTSPATDAISEAPKQLSWDDLEATEKVSIAVQVTGNHALLFAQDCKWHGSQSIKVCNWSTATFLGCNFQNIYYPVTVKDARTRFRGCTWSGANFAALLARGESEVDVVEGDFSLCPIAVYSGDTAQVSVSSSTAHDIQYAAFVTSEKSQATYHKCSMQSVGRVAVEAYDLSKVSLQECSFVSTKLAFYMWHGVSVSAERCDFREVFAVPKGKKTPKKKATTAERQVWFMNLWPEANNNIGDRISLKDCRFPPFEAMAQRE